MLPDEPFEFQNFVENRIGFGRYQILVMLSLIIVQMTDGIQAITISLITPILKAQMNLTQNNVSVFSSIFYLGVAIGSLLSGVLSNIHGRKPALILGVIFQIASGLLLALKMSFPWMCIFRMVYGMGFGSTLSVATIIATECLPMRYRGKGLIIINACNSFGKLLGVVLAFMFLQDEKKEWSLYMLVSVIPCVLALIMSSIYVKQSYRFYLSQHKHQQAFNIMDMMIMKNTGNIQNMLTEQLKVQIKQWSLQTFEDNLSNKFVMQKLLYEKRKLIFLCLSWFFVAFISFGELFIVAFMIDTQHGGLTSYFWMTFGELPSLILTFLLIQRKGFGRKTSLIIFFCLSSLFCFYVVFSVNSFSLFLAKMLIKATFQMMYPFTSESYDTQIRSIAFSVNSVVGRIGSAIMPFVIYPLFLSDSDYPFILFGLLSILGAISIMNIKQDTLLKPLDDKKAVILFTLTQFTSQPMNSVRQQNYQKIVNV